MINLKKFGIKKDRCSKNMGFTKDGEYYDEGSLVDFKLGPIRRRGIVIGDYVVPVKPYTESEYSRARPKEVYQKQPFLYPKGVTNLKKVKKRK
jgi:hypothetical protein